MTNDEIIEQAETALAENGFGIFDYTINEQLPCIVLSTSGREKMNATLRTELLAMGIGIQFA
jgi:hypothetical protein